MMMMVSIVVANDMLLTTMMNDVVNEMKRTDTIYMYNREFCPFEIAHCVLIRSNIIIFPAFDSLKD